ncbi:transposase [Xanthomonas citri]
MLLDDGDRLRYLHLMHEALHATGCQLHAFVLMDNHVHLLVTPSAAGRIGQLMQRLGRNYVALFDGRHGRTGTLRGKANTRHVLWTVRTTSFAAIATLSSIPCVLA